MKWITRARPKIDRLACPWLIQRFIDREAGFVFAPPADVVRLAEELGAMPFDVEGFELSHDGSLCGFDALLMQYGLGSRPSGSGGDRAGSGHRASRTGPAGGRLA